MATRHRGAGVDQISVIVFSGALALIPFGVANAAGPFDESAINFRIRHCDTVIQPLRPLAEKGDPTAQLCLGLAYADGLYGLPKDDALAVVWYRKAGERPRGL
jgi:TPR repeat protein